MSYRTRTQRNSNGRHHYQQEEESAEVALLRATHSQSLNVLKELFPDWSEEDLLFTLQDTYGDLELTVARISEGHASQWGEVKTRKPKKTPTYPRQKPRPQLRDTDTPQAQTLNIKPQHHRGKSVYHTDENGLLVASTEPNAQQKSGQLSSEETICETLGLSTQTDWSQDLPTPLGTTQTNKGTFTSEKERGNDTTRGNRSEGHRKSSKSNKDNLSGEKPQNGPGSTRGQKSRGRGGKSNSDSAHHSSSGNKIERGNSSRRRGGEGDNPSISNKTSRSKEKEPPVLKPAPVPENTWAKIASRATLPKPAPVQPPTTETNQSTVPEKIETSVSIETITAVVSTQEEEVTEVVQKVDITSANISSGQEFSALDLIESLTNSEQKPADSPSNSSSNRHAPAVLIPNMMASKMGNISNKFAKMNLSDLGLDLSTEETAPPSTSDIKCPPAPDTEPATSAEKPKDSRPTEPASSVPATTPHSDKPIEFEVSSETITVTKASTETLDHQVGKSHPVVPEQNAKSKTNDATNISSTSGLDTVASSQAPPRPHTQVQPQPQVPSQSQPQAPSQPQPQVQPQVPTQVPSSKPLPPTSAGQNQDSLYQPPMNQYYQQSQGYGQMPMHTNGAPGQLLMQGQMMHPQGQANYMPYYPYPYGPTHYNPYQTNNYTHQFAQKSLNGNYEDNNPNSFGQLASGGGPNHPPENGNVTNHGYDKSAHGKHKNYPDPSNDSGISGHGPPMNYNNFGYGVMPNYQPSGTPGDGPVYYPHPYYTQPSHNMFLGYPCSAGQPVPPHQQHNYGNNTHPLQQHHQGHQGHQPHSQPQTHYASHQQSNSNNRYQSWNN